MGRLVGRLWLVSLALLPVGSCSDSRPAPAEWCHAYSAMDRAVEPYGVGPEPPSPRQMVQVAMAELKYLDTLEASARTRQVAEAAARVILNDRSIVGYPNVPPSRQDPAEAYEYLEREFESAC